MNPRLRPARIPVRERAGSRNVRPGCISRVTVTVPAARLRPASARRIGRGRNTLALGLVVALAAPALGQAAPPASALVPFAVVEKGGIANVPASLTGKPGDPEAGERVVIDRRLGNCLGCHEITALRSEPFHGEIGPSLDGVAGRWETAALRMIIIDAKKVLGGETVMPAFYRIEGLHRVRPEFAGKPILSAQQVEDVVAYLATLK